MIDRFGTPGRADALARALDGGLPAGTGPLAGAPVLVARLRAVGAASAPAAAPRPEFRAALRTRLLAVAAVQAATQAAGAAVPAGPARATAPLEQAVSWAVGRRVGRGAGVAAGALASVVAVSGVAVAGAQSLPGDPFYGVKRTTEAFQLRTTDGDVGRGTLHLELATTRLREVRGLALGRDAARTTALSAGVPGAVTVAGQAPLADGAALGPAVAERVRETLADMDADTRRGTALLTRAFRDSSTPAPLTALARFVTRQSEGLEQLLPALPAAAQGRARVSLALLTDVSGETDALLGAGTCGPACDPATSAPTAGGLPTSTPGSSSDGSGPCTCEPAPTPAPQATAVPEDGVEPEPATTRPAPQPSSGSGSASAGPRPTRSPSAAPTSSDPLPLPSLPVPLPSLPLPLPSLPPLELPTLELPEPVVPLLPTLAPPVLDASLPGSAGLPAAPPSPLAAPRR